MSASQSVTPLSAVATALRSAGCVFAEDEAGLLLAAAADRAELKSMLDRRAAGTPLEHILGWAEFCGQRIRVDYGVFVPRRRTEVLAHHAAALTAPGAVVVDLCCGSGAVGAAIACARDQIELHAVDIDHAAVECAAGNVAGVGGRVYEGDLYTPLPATLRGHIDVIVANAPYVPTGAIDLMPGEARLHERRVALDGGSDGLDIQRRVIAAAAHWLAPHGHLLVETSEAQASLTAEAFDRRGLAPRVISFTERDATVVVGSPAAG